MFDSDSWLRESMNSKYSPLVEGFFTDLQNEKFSKEELEAVPSLFLPCWGEAYDTSSLKIAIAGKETFYWANDYGDSLFADLEAFKEGKYRPDASCVQFRKIDQGPHRWRNQFWQYPASVLGMLYDTNKQDVLQEKKDDPYRHPVLQSIAWFNGHAIETYDSAGITKDKITADELATIQKMADKHGLSRFDTFIEVFQPDVVLYFYRDTWGLSQRTFDDASGCEFRQSWGDGDAIQEFQIGDTIILNMRHTTWMGHGNMKEKTCADLVLNVLKQREILNLLPFTGKQHFDLYSMSATTWRHWVKFIRKEANKYPEMNNYDLSRHLILAIARELGKTNSTMTAQTLVLLLNEAPKFMNDSWQYSPECRGPCSTVRGAYNQYKSNGKDLDAAAIAEAFTKLNGKIAWD